MLKYLFTLLIFFAYIGSSHSSEVINIREEIDELIFTLRELAYYEDTTGMLLFKEIASPAFDHNFQPNPNYRTQDFNNSSTYWVRINIRHNKNSEKIWLLEFYDQTIDAISAYIPQESGRYKIIKMGDNLEFNTRQLSHKNFEVVLDNNSDMIRTYYFKINSHTNADIRIVLRSLERFVYYALNEYVLFGLFYGMILIICLYNLLIYMAFRETKFIIYILYLLSMAVFAMAEDGIAFQYLWPMAPQWNQIAAGVAIYSLIIWALIFTKKFLHTRINAPFLNKLLLCIVFLRSAVFLYALLFNNHWLDYRSIEIVPVTLIFYTSIYVWLKGYQPARFVVIAYGLLFVGFCLKLLVNAGIFPFSIISHYSLRISFLIEMLFLSLALGDKVRILKDNRDRVQQRIIKQHELNVKLKDKVNRELEHKVKERTLELDRKNQLLEASNQKILNQSKEINQINSILDLDNWTLKNNIKEALKYRMINKDLEYEEFKRIFPDKLACYRYLEELKWSKGFQCRKCYNEKFSNGVKKFSKRCTKCGYNESITAFSIFHGIKFPIDKAFYITYIVMSGKNDITLEELSEKLTLRSNTIWSFRKKVKEFISSRGNKKNMAGESWQSIIVSFESKIDHYRKTRLKIKA